MLSFKALNTVSVCYGLRCEAVKCQADDTVEASEAEGGREAMH